MRITSEESERQKRIGSSRRQNTTNAHCAQLELNAIQGSSKQEVSVPKPKTDPIKVNELTCLVEAMRQQSQPRPSDLVNPYSQNKVRVRRDKPYRPDCCQCLSCGEEGHRALGCLKRQKNQGNVNWSLQRGTQ